MSSEDSETIRAILSETASAHERFAASGVATVVAAAGAIGRALVGGLKVLALGNGGIA